MGVSWVKTSDETHLLTSIPEAADTTRLDGGNFISDKDSLEPVNIYRMSVRPRHI